MSMQNEPLTKEQLELQKLQLEIGHLRPSFLLQIFNTLSLVVVAFLVFWFFQRPQIDQMAATRIASERAHVEMIAIGIYNLNDEAAKRAMFEYLYKEYPQYSFLNSLRQSFVAVDALSPAPQTRPSAAMPAPVVAPTAPPPIPKSHPPGPSEPPSTTTGPRTQADPPTSSPSVAVAVEPSEPCADMQAKLASLQVIEISLNTEAENELAGNTYTKLKGAGEIFRMLVARRTAVRSEIMALSRRAVASGCSISKPPAQ